MNCMLIFNETISKGWKLLNVNPFLNLLPFNVMILNQWLTILVNASLLNASSTDLYGDSAMIFMRQYFDLLIFSPLPYQPGGLALLSLIMIFDAIFPRSINPFDWC